MSPVVNLAGKRGLVVGIANEHSIAAGCATAFRQAGAEFAVTDLNDKALPFVQPVAEALGAAIVVPCDVRVPGQLEVVFARIEKDWGRLDFLLHSIAFAPREDLQTSLVNCSAEGFALAMDVSCHPFIRMARLAASLMSEGGALLTVSFYGADRVVENYNLMGPVKAALESSVRYLAADLAGQRIRANTISAGAIKTAPPRVSAASTSSSTRCASARQPSGWSASRMSAASPPSSPARREARSPARSSMPMAGSIRSPDGTIRRHVASISSERGSFDRPTRGVA